MPLAPADAEREEAGGEAKRDGGADDDGQDAWIHRWDARDRLEGERAAKGSAHGIPDE